MKTVSISTYSNALAAKAVCYLVARLIPFTFQVIAFKMFITFETADRQLLLCYLEDQGFSMEELDHEEIISV